MFPLWPEELRVGGMVNGVGSRVLVPIERYVRLSTLPDSLVSEHVCTVASRCVAGHCHCALHLVYCLASTALYASRVLGMHVSHLSLITERTETHTLAAHLALSEPFCGRWHPG